MTIDFSIEEILLLQELTDDMEAMPNWLAKIGQSTVDKLQAAYQKPEMQLADFNRQLLAEELEWNVEGIDDNCRCMAVRRKARMLRFYNKIILPEDKK